MQYSVQDKMFQGRILDLVKQTIEYIRTQIKEHTDLGLDARFVTEPEYSEILKEISTINREMTSNHNVRRKRKK